MTTDENPFSTNGNAYPASGIPTGRLSAIRANRMRLNRAVRYLPILGLLCVMPMAREAWAGSSATLPFSASITTRPLNLGILSLYVDSPLRQVVMEGGVWVFGAQPDPYHNPISVPRWKGPDFEHMVRQPDGAADFSQRTASSFINSGLWYDKATRTLYALMHGEYDGREGAAWCRKKTWLATSRDLGVHWTFVGDVVTAVLPNPGDRLEYSGSEFEMGPADYDLYVDIRGGYFYHTSWNGFVAKNGILNHFTAGTMQVARCAISDKMVPGKWHKFNNGTWTEPGLGGKASRVGMTAHGIYGNTIYSTYLQKYVRIGVNIGVGDPRFANVGLRDNSVYISTCTDLAKQDWTPMAKLIDQPDNPLYGFTLAAEDGVDPSICGQTIHAYNFWSTSGRVLDIKFSNGVMNAAPFPPYGSYSYEPHPESGDRVESRQTKIVGCAGPDMRYSGSGWSFESNPMYYHGRINKCNVADSRVEFSFRGADIYWRAIAAQDGGKADVYIDDELQTTVDLYFWDTPLVFQFAFIKTGLEPSTVHTIRIVARGDKNANSRGTFIRHMAFEYSAESYWASAGFSSVGGKNNWHYQSRKDSTYRDLAFDAVSNLWSNDGRCVVGNNYQVPVKSYDAVRKWVAPHQGYVRLEGDVSVQFAKVTWDPVITFVSRPGTNRLPSDSGNRVNARIDQDGSNLMAVNLGSDGPPAAHDLYVKVNSGDRLYFTVAGGSEASEFHSALVNDDSSLISYSGSWTCDVSSPGYVKNDQHFSRKAGDYAEFKFSGTGIQWIGPRNIDCGMGEVYLDGVKVESVDMYAPAWEKNRVLYENSSLTLAPHIIKIVVGSNKNPSSIGTTVSIDAFVYRPGIDKASPGSK